MATVKRQVIKIDEEKCNGCGLCVPSCAEGAIQIIDGKARLVSDKYCDGLGACLGECPQSALTVEERDAEAFDESAVAGHLKSIGREATPPAHEHVHATPVHSHHGVGCPSARALDFRNERKETSSGDQPRIQSELGQWPVKIELVNPSAPYFEDADLLVAADCAPFAYANIHADFMKGKAVVIGCPKLNDVEAYLEKLTLIVARNDIKSVTVLHMEVPCCFGLMRVVRQAVEASGKNIPVEAKVVTLRGEIEEPKGIASLF
jgi:Pyruvate/2-oxoacid:ferredoxin oxidoreductase delta subunit